MDGLDLVDLDDENIRRIMLFQHQNIPAINDMIHVALRKSTNAFNIQLPLIAVEGMGVGSFQEI
eukprot:CAMPEP_0116131976 /NCGR_PEP_ID=MMETSP0329-20121206/9300_1 /TAXON_ID=697910 /ORGANISM="Pseudo-nitzschia arenysensis, Strain B593" /LENGTH=63 /DNA_ID=CAMNT_0003626457 /DNA_START=825 /DNA_END=1016 /DNA_ORIENTATION=+